MGKEFSHFRELRFLNTTTYYCMPIRMARMKKADHTKLVWMER